MVFRHYITLMTVGTLLCALSWFLVLFRIDPFAGGAVRIGLFYLTLFGTLVGLFSLLLLGARVTMHRDDLLFRHTTRSLRQGLVLSVLVICALGLAAFDRLTPLTLISIVIATVLIEAFLQWKRPNEHAHDPALPQNS